MEDKILETVLDNLEYSFCKDMLVKPLADEYVEKEIVKPVITGKDKDNMDLNDTEVSKEKVLTTFRKGIVLATPPGYQWLDADNHPEVGDIVAYPRKTAIDFDLYKTSQLINPYNVVAFIKKN